MVKWTKKEIIIFLIILSLVLIVPIIIHILYKFDFEIDFLYSTWSSGEILQYCGTIITALLAIIGIYYTLKENRKENLEQTIIGTKPYLRTDFISLSSFTELEKFLDNNNLIFISKFNGIEIIDMKNIQGKRKLREFDDKNNISEYYKVFVYEIENIGLGNAMNLSLKFGDYVISDNNALCKNEKIMIYILIEKSNIKKAGTNIDFELTYRDAIDVNCYQQYEKKHILYDKVKDEILYDNDLSTKISEPLIIEKKIFK